MPKDHCCLENVMNILKEKCFKPMMNLIFYLTVL